MLSLRVSTQEFEILKKKCGATTCRKLSEYMRKKLLDKAIVTTYRNASMDEQMAELILLRKELNNIGNNFNQVVHKLHMVDHIPELKIWFKLYDGNRVEVTRKMEEIKGRINQMAELWLQR